MKRFVHKFVTLLVTILFLCSLGTVAFAATEYSGVHTWTCGNLSYSATVVRTDAVNQREVPIMSSGVTLPRNGSHTFGNRYYSVSYSSTLWTDYTSQLATAGAKINVYPTYTQNVNFVNSITFSSPNVPGTFYAFTTCYGHPGNCYVQRHSGTPQTMYTNNFSFAPFNYSNTILYVLSSLEI